MGKYFVKVTRTVMLSVPTEYSILTHLLHCTFNLKFFKQVLTWCFKLFYWNARLAFCLFFVLPMIKVKVNDIIYKIILFMILFDLYFTWFTLFSR